MRVNPRNQQERQIGPHTAKCFDLTHQSVAAIGEYCYDANSKIPLRLSIPGGPTFVAVMADDEAYDFSLPSVLLADESRSEPDAVIAVRELKLEPFVTFTALDAD